MKILVVLIACLLSKGHGAADFVDPPTGTRIADFEGTLENAVTITCNITNAGIQISTQWNIENYRNNPALQGLSDQVIQTIPELTISGDLRPNSTSTFRNRLTILVLSSDLDGVIIYCGTGIQPRQANYSVRVYRPPNLQDNLRLNIVENTVSVPVELSQSPVAFPQPTLYTWSKDGQAFNSPSLTYSSVTFAPLRKSDAGNYMVSATNYIIGSSTEQVGNDTGSFFLNVIYGPSFREPGPAQQYALFDESLSLVCGIGLDSNPQAIITWTAPDATIITMNIGRYTLDNGPDVRLNFSRTIANDTGVWVCDVRVMSAQNAVSDGSLVEVDPTVIGVPITRNIQLTVIGPPSQPLTLSVDMTGATYFRVCWEEPRNILSSISYYLINVTNLNGTGGVDDTFIRNTTTDDRVFNITGLLPGTTYELTVVAVSQGGNIVAKSEPSESVMRSTGLTVPALMCNIPEFMEGGITARWSYIHTGGQDLTSVLVSYTIEEGGLDSRPISVMNTDPTINSINVPRLTAGTRYTFNITAVNDIGSSYVLCGPTLLNIGIPLAPTVGDLLPGSSTTEIRIQIKTLASGEYSGFRFNIIPVRNGMEETRQVFMNSTYQSGIFVTLTVKDLTEGGTYTFSATAQNDFGESEDANSRSIVIGELQPPSVGPPPTQQQQGNNSVGAAVGGAIGGIAVVALIVLIVIVIILLFVRRGKAYHPKEAEDVRYQLAPTSESNTKVKEVPIDIGEDMGDKRKEDTEIQYAELDTFRPPSQQKNNAPKETKPVEPEEPVEYAVITTFKKKENESAPAVIETSAVPDPTPDTTTSEGDADKTGTSTTLV